MRRRQQQRECRITDEPVQTIAAQQHAIAGAQLDDRERRLDIRRRRRLQDRATALAASCSVAGGDQRRVQRLIA
jgi:hypothetical protein